MTPPRRPPVPAPTADSLRETLGAVVDREGGGPAGWERDLAAFLGLLLERNAAVNLISRRTAEEVVVRQVLPSLAALRLAPPGTALRVLDIGSGGGFPAIPLRILRPDVRIDLVEATRNKCRFLEDSVGLLGWTDARVHWCRLENPAPELTARAPFDLAMARAVGNDALVAEAAAPLVRAGGGIWVFSSPSEGDDAFCDDEGAPVTALRRLR